MNYRTPNITEFKVGFEFEMDAGTGWCKQVFPNPWWNSEGMGGMPTLQRCIESGEIRVQIIEDDRTDT